MKLRLKDMKTSETLTCTHTKKERCKTKKLSYQNTSDFVKINDRKWPKFILSLRAGISRLAVERLPSAASLGNAHLEGYTRSYRGMMLPTELSKCHKTSPRRQKSLLVSVVVGFLFSWPDMNSHAKF